MIDASAFVLMIIWLLGMVTGNTFGGAIHGLVLAAILGWFWDFIRDRRNGATETGASDPI